MTIVGAAAGRATCDRGRSGAIIVKDKRIIATGYVGSPPGLPHCDEDGHLIREVINEEGKKSMHCIRTLHAEQNAILQAARYGVSINGATLYCTMTPCFNCAKMIVAVGVKRVVVGGRYHADGLSVELFNVAGVKLDILEDAVVKYDNQ